MFGCPSAPKARKHCKPWPERPRPLGRSGPRCQLGLKAAGPRSHRSRDLAEHAPSSPQALATANNRTRRRLIPHHKPVTAGLLPQWAPKAVPHIFLASTELARPKEAQPMFRLPTHFIFPAKNVGRKVLPVKPAAQAGPQLRGSYTLTPRLWLALGFPARPPKTRPQDPQAPGANYPLGPRGPPWQATGVTGKVPRAAHRPGPPLTRTQSPGSRARPSPVPGARGPAKAPRARSKVPRQATPARPSLPGPVWAPPLAPPGARGFPLDLAPFGWPPGAFSALMAWGFPKNRYRECPQRLIPRLRPWAL